MDQGNMFNDATVIIKKNLKLLFLVVVIAAIAGIVFSSDLFLKPRYKSFAVVYPINLDPHSDESETEQMLQLFAHEDIKDAVLNTFKLYERWDDLQPGTPEYWHWANELYQERVSISPTRYESVEIVCQDEDPIVARDMALLIIEKFNDLTRQADRDLHQEYLELKNYEVSSLQVTIDSLEKRMRLIRMNSGLLDFDSQSERVTEGYMQMLRNGVGGSKMAEVQELITNLAENGSELEVLQQMTGSLKEYYTELTKDRVQELSKANGELNYAKVVVEPHVNDKKSYPIRWIIVVMSVLLGTIAALILIVLKERFSSAS